MERAHPGSIPRKRGPSYDRAPAKLAFFIRPPAVEHFNRGRPLHVPVCTEERCSKECIFAWPQLGPPYCTADVWRLDAHDGRRVHRSMAARARSLRQTRAPGKRSSTAICTRRRATWEKVCELLARRVREGDSLAGSPSFSTCRDRPFRSRGSGGRGPPLPTHAHTCQVQLSARSLHETISVRKIAFGSPRERHGAADELC